MGGKSSAPQYSNGLQAQSAPTSSFANPAPPMGTPAINSYAQQFNGPAQQYGGGKFPNGAQAQAPSKWGQQAPPGPNTGWGTTSSGQNQDAPGFTNPYDTAPTTPASGTTAPTAPTAPTASGPTPGQPGWQQQAKQDMSGNAMLQTSAPGQFMTSLGLDPNVLAGAGHGGGATAAQAAQVTAAFNKLPAEQQLSLLNSGSGGSSLYNMLIQGGNSQAAQGSWYTQANYASGFGQGSTDYSQSANRGQPLAAYGGQQGGYTTNPTFGGTTNNPTTPLPGSAAAGSNANGLFGTGAPASTPPSAPTVPGNPFGVGSVAWDEWNQQHQPAAPTPLNRSPGTTPAPRGGPTPTPPVKPTGR